MEPVTYRPIGVVRSPYTALTGMPLQPVAAPDVAGTVEVAPEFQAGLRDIAGFSHLILLYHLHEMEGYALEVRPFLDEEEHGIFATRAPKRPNSIGLSVMRLEREGGTLHITGVDILDGTPLLDIKPHVPLFDSLEGGADRLVHRQHRQGLHRARRRPLPVSGR